MNWLTAYLTAGFVFAPIAVATGAVVWCAVVVVIEHLYP